MSLSPFTKGKSLVKNRIVGFLGFTLAICSSGYVDAACSWESIAKTAVDKSGIIRGSNAEIESRVALKRSAFGRHLPTIDLVAKKGDSNTSIFNTSSSKEVEEYGFEVGLSLFEGFAVSANVAKREAEIEAAKADRDLRSQELRYELRRAYFRNLIIQERVRFTRDLAMRRRETLRLMRLKYKSGREAKWGVEKSESDLLQVEHRLSEEQELLRLSRKEIAVLTGNSEIECEEVAGSIESILSEKTPSDFRVDQHPKIRELDYKLEASRQEERIAESAYFPSVSAGYSYKKQGNETVPDPVSVSSWIIAVKFNIFDGLSKKQNVEAARAKQVALDAERLTNNLRLKLNLERTRSQYKLKRKSIPVMLRVYDSAKRRLETVSKQYNLGLKSFIDWEQAQIKLAEAEIDLVAAKADALQALADWEKSYGMRLEDR